ncbi:MAG: hypothetical protein HQL80_06800 [Magnetococcales bacterium]|nr:hypothetical protein [Magnetococcales bacterium]
MAVTAPYGTIPSVEQPATVVAGKQQNSDQLKLDFLKLLTTQLQYQDPLSPTDNTEFTSQMAQFSTLDAQNRSNDLLQQLLTAQGAGAMNQAVSYIGKQVVVPGNQTTVKGGAATVHFQMPEAGDATVQIYNQTGALVGEALLQGVQSGERSAVINGIGGGDGNYLFSVSRLGSDGTQTALSTFVANRVTGVVNGDTGVMLDMDGQLVALADVRRVEQADAL